jgi:lysophospholipase L1-like esterase
MADAIPLQRAHVEEKPDVIIAMVGVNNLQGFKPEIPVQDLTAKLENFCDRMEEWLPPGAKIILSTVPPANDAKDPGNPHRNERHRLFGEQVVKPLVERRIAVGKPYTLADTCPALIPDQDLSDSVHPNKKSGKGKLNEVWAEAVLRELGKLPPAPVPTSTEPKTEEKNSSDAPSANPA